MRLARKLLVAAVSLFVLSAPAFAQQKGLDGLSDEQVVQELARFGMDNLLEHYFKTHDVSAQQQAGVRAMMSIRTLLNDSGKLTAAQRQQIVQKIVAGADSILPALNDPRQLMQLASALITSGMERNANTIEYWGENPRSQAELRPVAELVAKVLELCSRRASEQSEKLVESFGNNPTPNQLKEYTALDNLATTAAYTRMMADYYRAMAIPQSDPARGKIAEDAIEGLREYDTTDSQIQPLVRLRIGKLQMVKGDYAAARKTLLSVATNPNNEIEPAPDILQQYEARYFATVSDLLSRNVDATARSIAELQQWQESKLPEDKAVRDGAKASLAMLNYRLNVLKAELASDDAGRKAAQDAANAVLQQLAKDRPELRSIIFEQLVKSLPEDAPAKSMDTLMLKALVQKGIGEQLKPEGAQFDRKAVERAIAACHEIISRKGQPGTDDDLVNDVSIVLPQLMEKLSQDADAARAYLAYVETSRNNANRAAAMQNALAAIGRLRAANPSEAEPLFDRALPVAVWQFARKELAYDLGRRLQQQGKYAEAIKAYALVPRNDKRAIVADFFRMQSMKLELDSSGSKLDPKARTASVEAIRKAAEELRKSAGAARASAGADAERNRYGLIEARARLMLAALLKETEPLRTVQVLEGFEQSVQSLPGSDDLQAEALFLRVHSLMAAGQNAQATESLLQLLQTKAGEQGAAIIFNLLTKLDSDLDLARRAGDSAKAKNLLDARAALSGPLVEWAKNNKDERIRKYTYQYTVFDAATKQQAAMAETDVQKRVQGLRQALALYDNLLTGENIRRWAATVDPAKVDLKYGDVTVHFAKAQVLYELAEYKDAAARFGKLLEDRKLGMPRIITTKDGEVTSEDNPQYWEAMYKLYRSNVELASNPATPNAAQLKSDTQNGLKRLYIREGQGVGGDKWRGEFEKLRREIIPDFVVE